MNLVFRLKPGSDLKKSIEQAVKENRVKAGYIITCVGGLKQATVRMAGARPDSQDIRTFKGNYEIVSLVGTVSLSDSHLHISFSDKEGIVYGGHLKEDTIVHLTAEIVIGVENDLEFMRELDQETGFSELSVKIKS